MLTGLCYDLFGVPDRELIARRPEWGPLAKQWLVANPTCAACGIRKYLVPHHIWPVSWKPELELDWNNLMTLCESPTHNCHLIFGHLLIWTSRNPDAVKDAANYLQKITKRPYREYAL